MITDTEIHTTAPTTQPVVVDAVPIKPGWQTSEFWLGLATKLLGGAYATGLIGDGTIYARIAGLAVVVLAYFGYTVSRGLVKAAGALLLVMLLTTPQVACSSLDQVKADTVAIANGAVTCAKADLPAVKALGYQLGLEVAASLFAGHGIPWSQLELDAEAGAKAQGIAVGSCAFGQLISDIGKLLPAPTTPTVMARADDGRSELALFKARLGVTAIQLESGQAL